MNEALIKPLNNDYTSSIIKEEHPINTYKSSLMVSQKKPLRLPSRNVKESSATYLYLKEIVRTTLLTALEEKNYATLNLMGDQTARAILIKSNVRFVVKVASLYRNRGLSFLDLVQEGNIGLIKAIDKFNPELGNRLTTYAMYWIRQSIDLAIMNQGNTIRVPTHILKEIKQHQKAKCKLIKTLSYVPTFKETATYLGITQEKVKKLALMTQRISTDNTERAYNLNIEDISDTEKLEPPMLEQRRMMQEHVTQCVLKLPPKYKNVICRRFGLCGYDVETLDQIATDLHFSIEHVRQVQCVAISKLKLIFKNNNLNYQALLDY